MPLAPPLTGMGTEPPQKPPAPPAAKTQPEHDVTAQIASELYTTLEQLSADPELLSVVGSWRDTLNDDEILAHLRSFNRTGKVLRRPQ